MGVGARESVRGGAWVIAEGHSARRNGMGWGYRVWDTADMGVGARELVRGGAWVIAEGHSARRNGMV